MMSWVVPTLIAIAIPLIGALIAGVRSFTRISVNVENLSRSVGDVASTTSELVKTVTVLAYNINSLNNSADNLAKVMEKVSKLDVEVGILHRHLKIVRD